MTPDPTLDLQDYQEVKVRFVEVDVDAAACESGHSEPVEP
jgi:hypothetical protein